MQRTAFHSPPSLPTDAEGGQCDAIYKAIGVFVIKSGPWIGLLLGCKNNKSTIDSVWENTPFKKGIIYLINPNAIYNR